MASTQQVTPGKNGKVEFTTADDLFHGGNSKSHNPSEIFMTPGTSTASDVEKILLKSYIDDRDDAIAITNLASRCIYLNNQMGLADLNIFLCAKAAIKGGARTYGLQASTNAIAPDTLNTFSGGGQPGKNGGRSVFGRIKDRATRNNDDEGY